MRKEFQRIQAAFGGAKDPNSVHHPPLVLHTFHAQGFPRPPPIGWSAAAHQGHDGGGHLALLLPVERRPVALGAAHLDDDADVERREHGERDGVDEQPEQRRRVEVAVHRVLAHLRRT